MPDRTYIPFEDGLIFESQGYGKVQKCQFCGKPAEHANCKAHRKECPLHCDNSNQPPSVCIGDGLIIMITLGLIYLIYKIKN